MSPMFIEYLVIFLVIFFLQVLFFIYASIYRTDKVTDLSYGLTFILGALAALIIEINTLSLFKGILFGLVTIWGLRLSTYLFIRILKTGKDKRFDGIREDTFKFASFWLLQAVSIFVILLPTTYILLKPIQMEFNTIAIVGIVLGALGILIEGLADYQKYIFKNDTSNKGKWIDTGLWKYSRHPNYLGEIMMWVGVYIFAIPYLTDFGWLTIISPLYILALLLFVSGVPTLEKKDDDRYKGNSEYVEYKKNTGLLLPKIF